MSKMEAPVSNTVVKETPKVEPVPAKVEPAVKVEPKVEVPVGDAATLKQSVQEPVTEPKVEPKVEEPKVEPEEKTEAEKKAEQNKIAKRIERLNQKTSPQVQVPGVVDTGDEVTNDQVKSLIEQGRTFEAIKLVEDRAGRRVAQAMQQQITQTQTTQQQQQEYTRIKTESNKKVWEKYPEVLTIDELAMSGDRAGAMKLANETPIYKALGEVYEEKPHLQYLADGAEIALEIAERRLGIVEGTKKAKAEGVKQEAARAASVEAASVIAPAASAGASATPAKSVNLSNDEKMVARKMGLTEEEYSANMGRSAESHVRVIGPDYYKKYAGPVRRKG